MDGTITFPLQNQGSYFDQDKSSISWQQCLEPFPLQAFSAKKQKL
jgi:hypothetical protein